VPFIVRWPGKIPAGRTSNDIVHQMDLYRTTIPIYLVDDDEAYCKSLDRLLKSAVYRAKSFSSAREFLDAVPAQDGAGVLILDLRMPGMDGFSLQKKLRECKSPLKVIVITADAQSGDRERALQFGAIGFFQKPIQADAIFELIDKGMKAKKL